MRRKLVDRAIPSSDDDADVESRSAETKELIPSARALLWIAGGLVFIAGLQLFVFSTRTERLFAWTIDVPLTAAFLGAGYWASVAFEWLAARERTWANARVALPTVFLFTVLTLVATLVHLDLFHLDGSFPTSARMAAWGWLAIYVVVPLAMAIILVMHLRAPGVDPERSRPLPSPLRIALAAQAIVMIALGAYLFLSPGRAGSMWPWPLTPLTGRAVGAWVVSIGSAAVQVVWDNDGRRARVAGVAYLLLGLLELVAVARYPETVAWEEPQAPLYVAFLASMMVAGTAILRSEGSTVPR